MVLESLPNIPISVGWLGNSSHRLFVIPWLLLKRTGWGREGEIVRSRRTGFWWNDIFREARREKVSAENGRLREEIGLIKVTQRKLAHQVLTELKNYRFTAVELGEINTRTCWRWWAKRDAWCTAYLCWCCGCSIWNWDGDRPGAGEQDVLVQGNVCDVGSGQMTEDQLAIWNRLNEIRLTQEQEHRRVLQSRG